MNRRRLFLLATEVVVLVAMLFGMGHISTQYRAIAAVTNVVSNPGFESDWASWDAYTYGNTSIASDAHSGSKSAQLGSGVAYRTQNISLSPSTEYTFQVWIKASSSGDCRITVKGEGFNYALQSGATSYTSKQRTFTTPGSFSWAQVQMWSQSGTCKFDDVSVGTGTASTTTPAPTNTPSGSSWTLVWSDEFNDGSVDTSKWNILNEPNGINNDIAYMTPSNVYETGGNLVLRQTECNVSSGGYNFSYCSGKVNSRYKFAFTYGRVEVRAKPPAGKGLHTAYWMMMEGCSGTATGNNNCIWPPEIDILEVIGQEPNIVHFNYHYGYPNHEGDGTWDILSYNVTDGFHVYAMEWDANKIRWYMDGALKFSATQGVGEADDYGDLHLILDTTIGGNWPGNPDGSTVFPNYNYVDYIRVYQLGGSPAPTSTPAPTNTPIPPTATPTPPPTANNEVSNPGFESDWANWNAYTYGSTSMSSDAHSGSKAAQLAGVAYRTQNISLSPNTSYTLEAWIKASGGTCYAELKGDGFSQTTTSSAGSYTKKSLNLTTGSSVSWAQVQLYSWGATCKFDDISVTEN